MDAVALRQELRGAARLLSAYGLNLSSKWALEMLCGLPAAEPRGASGAAARSTAAPALQRGCEYASQPSVLAALRGEGGEGGEEEDVLALAKACFDGKEFQRCAHLIEGTCGGRVAELPPRARFLRWYALYLDGERRKELDRLDSPDSLGRSRPPVNPCLQQLHAEVVAAEGGRGGGLDAFGAYMLGVLCKALDRPQEARAAFARALTAFPLLWAAGVDVVAVCASRGELDDLPLPPHWALDVVRAHAYVHLHASSAALALLAPLSAAFPLSAHLQSCTARALYDLRWMDASRELFGRLRAAHPHRMEEMDTFSNVLYVAEERGALATLAGDVYRSDRFRPSSCVVLGNYYSLRREPDKAVSYFRRALRLDPSYAAAWTLMGHEYLELKNTSAAIECYRRATGASAADFRAWYGLGQTYELLSMYLYACYYYRKAASLRPGDARMWLALGACGEKMDRKGDAVAAYEHAAALEGDREGVASLALARLYRNDGNAQLACKYYGVHVVERTADEKGGGRPSSSPELAEALLFLANAAAGDGRKQAAEQYASRILAMTGVAVEAREARALLDGLRAEETRASKAAGRLGAGRSAVKGGLLSSLVSPSRGTDVIFTSPGEAAFGSAARGGASLFGGGGGAPTPVDPGRLPRGAPATPGEPSGDNMSVDFSP